MQLSTHGNGDSRDQGFSLIEVLVAVAILGFVALGIASLFSQAIMVNASGFDYAQMASEARRALETIKGTSYLDAALKPTTSGTVALTDRMPSYASVPNVTVTMRIDEFNIKAGTDVTNMAGWSPPGVENDGNIKRVTIFVDASERPNLPGRRQFVATAFIARGRL
jgi:prepilin-type N-terminal cleavage/methylation domain-containing protein